MDVATFLLFVAFALTNVCVLGFFCCCVVGCPSVFVSEEGWDDTTDGWEAHYIDWVLVGSFGVGDVVEIAIGSGLSLEITYVNDNHYQTPANVTVYEFGYRFMLKSGGTPIWDCPVTRPTTRNDSVVVSLCYNDRGDSTISASTSGFDTFIGDWTMGHWPIGVTLSLDAFTFTSSNPAITVNTPARVFKRQEFQAPIGVCPSCASCVNTCPESELPDEVEVTMPSGWALDSDQAYGPFNNVAQCPFPTGTFVLTRSQANRHKLRLPRDPILGTTSACFGPYFRPNEFQFVPGFPVAVQAPLSRTLQGLRRQAGGSVAHPTPNQFCQWIYESPTTTGCAWALVAELKPHPTLNASVLSVWLFYESTGTCYEPTFPGGTFPDLSKPRVCHYLNHIEVSNLSGTIGPEFCSGHTYTWLIGLPGAEVTVSFTT